jgi:uracil-DNA glycosylase
MMEWDPGPPPNIRTIFEAAPLAEYQGKPKRFRLEWGPHYYRGRLDGSARALIIGQDPAADENVARRILVGDAGQRVQGLLVKLGLTRSYIMVNSSLYCIFGQFDAELQAFMDLPSVTQWRNQLLTALAGPSLQVILAMGQAAQHVVDVWPGAAALNSEGRIFKLLHPTARPEPSVKQNWSGQLNAIAAKLTPDPDGHLDLSPYPSGSFSKQDLANIPLRDFGFGAPAWMGTGNMATRVQASKGLPAMAKNNPSIIWSALGRFG